MKFPALLLLFGVTCTGWLCASSISDPCGETAAPPAVKDALRMACSRDPVAGNRMQKVLVIGILGGFVKRDDPNHPEVWYAEYLRSRYGGEVYVEVFENHHAKKAVDEIIETVRRLDTNHDGMLASTEGQPPKIIIYGHSWGASQVLWLARELEQHKIPVSLTIQIDSVRKPGQDDHTVPANVAKAVNFYQTKGLTHAQTRIVEADAARTQILGNFRMTYEDHRINCDNYKWLSRLLNRPHHEIENDPRVWDQITALIDAELSRTNASIDASSLSRLD